MKPINKFLLCCFLLLTLGTDLYAQQQLNSTDKVCRALRYRNNGLTLVCAHRGKYRGTPYPENSLASVYKAAQANVDLIEIDVRSTSDGVPILSHDETLGRLVWGFNPYGHNENPRVDQRTWDDLKWRALREENNHTSDETVASFEQVLQLVRDRYLSIVIILDLKDVATAQRCWNIVKRYSNAWGTPAHNWVIFKMNPYLFNSPADLEYKMSLRFWFDQQNFKFIPAFRTGVHFNNPSPISVYRSYRSKKYFMAAEVEVKEWDRRLQNLVNDVKNTSNDGLVVFQPVPEVGSNFYYDGKTGKCCKRLSDNFATGPLPDEWDNRPSVNFLYQQGFSCIITDNFEDAAKFLWQKNKRNMCPIRTSCRGREGNEEELAATSAEGAYPNPTDGPITLSLPTDSAGTAQLSLFDLQGKNVLVKSELLQAGNNEVALNLKEQGAKPGIYMLQAILPDQRRKTFKIVVQ